MPYNPDIHQRRSLRLKGYDYSQAGAYFVTICAQGKECFFGEVMDGEMRGNELGDILVSEWVKSAGIRSEIELGPYVVMPNHFHGIIFIVGDNRWRVPNPPNVKQTGLYPFRRGDRRVALPGGPPNREPAMNNVPSSYRLGEDPHEKAIRGKGDQPVAPTIGPQPRSVGAMVAGFKSAVTKRINVNRNMPGTPVWQRNYYEHVIRDEDDTNRIVEYISTNPQRWPEDSLHPDNVTPA